MEFEQKYRYQTVKEMEKDLLNYQMGYSVSAKQDNALDIIKKFYKRNKLLAIVSGSFLFVFIIGSIFFITSLQSQRNKSNEALVKAELAIKQFENEKLERIADNKNSAPTYYAKAQIEAQLDKFADAEKLMDTAISYDAKNQTYRLYRGCLAFTNNEMAKAKADLALVKNHPNQKFVQQIIDILNTPNLKAIDERQKPTLANLCNSLKLFDISQKITNDLAKKLEIWNKKLVETWGNTNFTLANSNNKILFQRGSQKPDRLSGQDR